MQASLHIRLTTIINKRIATYNDKFPTELADLLGLALPWPTQKSIMQRTTPQVAGTTDK
jgi:hypothetical protein